GRPRPSLELDDRLVRADELAALDEGAAHLSARGGADLVEQLHRFDEPDDVTLRDLAPDLDERLGLRRWRAIEDARERRVDRRVIRSRGRFGGRRDGSRRDGGGR